MEIHANFDERIVIRPDDYVWVDSPSPGVERMMLDRVGGEIARATSLVRYAPNSQFPRHHHGGGEEILVLEGEFADEHGKYGPGYYLRNPVGTSHAPSVGPDGALILVKLHQFEAADTEKKALDTANAAWLPGMVTGLSVQPLHSFEHESVALVRWQPNTRFSSHQHWGGEEIFVISGRFNDEHGSYPAGSWLRSPHGSRHQPFTDAEGALIYVKTGHLADVACDPGHAASS